MVMTEKLVQYNIPETLNIKHRLVKEKIFLERDVQHWVNNWHSDIQSVTVRLSQVDYQNNDERTRGNIFWQQTQGTQIMSAYREIHL
jgi:hypothetical protein